MTYDCVVGDHEDCPDNEVDSYTCSCPCHLSDDERVDTFDVKAMHDSLIGWFD